MMPPEWPRRQNDLDIWVCDECDSRFGLLADFNQPTFCPNCSSQEVRKAEVPNDPRKPNRPDWIPEYWM